MHKRRDAWAWGCAGAAGAGWGWALARVLALEARLPFFLNLPGALFLALLTASAALLWVAVRKEPSWNAACRLTPLFLPLLDLAGGPVQPWRGPVLIAGALLLTALLHLRRPLPDRVGFLAVFCVALAVYLPDVAPWVGRADTFEFQVVAPRLGVAHPSGYPLYILVGKLFSLIPFGSIAWRVNLSSAICAALAAAFLFLALRHLSTFSFPQRSFSDSSLFIPAFLLAFSPTLWSRAVEAEVYGLNALLVALTLCLAVRWVSGDLGPERALPWLGLLAGLGVAAHLTLGALGLLLLPLVLTARPRPALRSLAAAAGLFAAGLALYLYIPLRWPALNGGETMSLSHFWAFVTNAESGGALRPLACVQDPARWGVVLRLLRAQVGWGGLALALLGVGSLFRRRWALALGTVLACAAWVWFNLSFYVAEPDYSAFSIPAHVVLVFWLGGGLAWGLAWLQRRAALLLPLALALAALLPLSRLWLTGPLLDTAQERADDAWGRYVLSLPIASDAAILADSEKFPPLYFLQQVEELRPDLDLVMRFDEAGYAEELAARLAAGQDVYLARYLPNLGAHFLRSLGPLVEVGSVPLDAPPASARPAAARFGAALDLLAFDLAPDPLGRPMHHVTLYWRAAAPLTDDVAVRLRLEDGAGRTVWSTEGARPVGGNYPTNAWAVGAVVPDYHALVPPAWVAPGAYRLAVGVFPRFSEEGLAVSGQTGAWYPLAALDVSPPADPLPQRAAFSFGDAWLVGYDGLGQAVAGAPVEVDLAWAGAAQARAGRLTWIDAGGHSTGEAVLDVRPGAVRSRHVITAPVAAGVYRLRLAVAGERARCGWLAGATSACDLGAVEVLPAWEGLANFNGRILLEAAAVEGEALDPGAALAMTLRWRALRVPEDDYTVTVQLVGPDGRLYGQVDAWPVQGTRPTSGWVPGETLEDPYRVALSPDAPPGRYQVVVGWYLLATMERLNVVDPFGQPVADHVVVGEVAVP
ncbi:MAG: DUF2723 domain-containing protein [Anaerolineae bacterium]|nr:DUF2723 domain-containing protein [Anaerolineae bacterium]